MTNWRTFQPVSKEEHLILINEIQLLRKEIKELMSTVPTGLAALTQADADLAAAITANTTETTAVVAAIAALSAQLTALNSEDPQVATIAADLETKVAALTANTTALTAAIAPPASTTPAAS
jgi:phage shock protein A